MALSRSPDDSLQLGPKSDPDRNVSGTSANGCQYFYIPDDNLRRPELRKIHHEHRRYWDSSFERFYCYLSSCSAVVWGNSKSVGIGDTVLVGGYPYGAELFRITELNRGFIRPTFYVGIISAIIPTMKEQETRLLQLSVAVAGGMTGGAVFSPRTGRVIGMVTSGLEGEGGSIHPVTYALPSEIIEPFIRCLLNLLVLRATG